MPPRPPSGYCALRPLLTFLAAVGVVGRLKAQSIEEYPLRASAPKAVEAPPEEIAYRLSGLDDRGFNRVVRPVSTPTLTVYRPAQQAVPVENSTRLAAALERARVPVASHIFATGGHGFALGRGEESACWKDSFLRWLEAGFRAAP